MNKKPKIKQSEKLLMVQVRGLSKKYKKSEVYALSELNFQIQKGDVYGILGPNGAGKTTLISILCGLIKTFKGTVEIDGKSFQKNKNSIKSSMGVVPQDYALYSTLTAKENLQYFGGLYGLEPQLKNQKIDTLLNILGLTQYANIKIQHFSGGMKRRVNLIAALLHNPEILFLDEPTVGIDVQSKIVILDYLKKLNQEGLTIVYTSHHMNEAEKLCNQILILDQGKIVLQGNTKEVMNSHPKVHSLEELYLELTGNKLRDFA